MSSSFHVFRLFSQIIREALTVSPSFIYTFDLLLSSLLIETHVNRWSTFEWLVLWNWLLSICKWIQDNARFPFEPKNIKTLYKIVVQRHGVRFILCFNRNVFFVYVSKVYSWLEVFLCPGPVPVIFKYKVEQARCDKIWIKCSEMKNTTSMQ